MKHRKGLLHYVELAVLLVLSIPFGWLALLFGMKYNIPTPGVYVPWLFPLTGHSNWGPSFPRVVAAGFVNVICCYLTIRGLATFVARFRRRNNPATPSVRT